MVCTFQGSFSFFLSSQFTFDIVDAATENKHRFVSFPVPPLNGPAISIVHGLKYTFGCAPNAWFSGSIFPSCKMGKVNMTKAIHLHTYSIGYLAGKHYESFFQKQCTFAFPSASVAFPDLENMDLSCFLQEERIQDIFGGSFLCFSPTSIGL